MAESNNPMVASLNFGTTYSCYAYSTKDEFMEDPMKIHDNPAWKSGRQIMTIKTPTCVLLDINKKLVAFGYEAENRYQEFVSVDEMDDFYFFQRFTTFLHSSKVFISEVIS